MGNTNQDDFDMGERICTCGAVINKDELMHCAVCNTWTCPYCSIHIATLLYEEVSEKIRAYILEEMNNKEGTELCPECLEKYKIQYVMQIPVHRLPLYINENWGSDKVSKVYKTRLAGESIVEPKEAQHGPRQA